MGAGAGGTVLNRVQLAVCGLLMFACAALGWQAQGWRCGRMMAEQGETRAQALVVQLQGEREQRQGLAQRLRDTESRHFKELSDAQQSQARLRDRLATADVRLSALVERDGACAAVPAATGAAGVDHGAVRARLESAHAGRIIAITDGGDRGLIALRGCQDYVREVLGRAR